MPILREYRFNEARSMQALEGIYSTVILRDVLQRNTQSNQGLLHKLILYIQVTESMLSPETRERELRPLQMIPDNYEKIVLSMDRNYITSYDGIKSMNLIDWLLA